MTYTTQFDILNAVSKNGANTDALEVVPGSGANFGTPTQSTFYTGAKSAIGGTALQITTASHTLVSGMLVKAASTNTGIIYIGGSGVTAGTTDATDGFELTAGESVLFEVSNSNLLYAIGSTTGQKVFWSAV